MYNKIMVPLDGSELAECVLPHVEAITSGCQVTDVVLVRVIDPLRLPASVPAKGEYGFTEKEREKLEEHHRQAADEYLKNTVFNLTMADAKITYDVIEGKVADSLTDYSISNGVDLIVMASHGRSGISRWVLGSVAERMVRHSCVPVLMVRAPGCEPKL
ncbi:MAG: universal stress protein [Desulfobacterales bacterium]|jgi:nucleotide-binding universal stress UspA family protein